MALEVGGRWNGEAAAFIRFRAQTCSCAVPVPLQQQSTAQALIANWPALLTHAVQTTFARNLVPEDARPHTAVDGAP